MSAARPPSLRPGSSSRRRSPPPLRPPRPPFPAGSPPQVPPSHSQAAPPPTAPPQERPSSVQGSTSGSLPTRKPTARERCGGPLPGRSARGRGSGRRRRRLRRGLVPTRCAGLARRLPRVAPRTACTARIGELLLRPLLPFVARTQPSPNDPTVRLRRPLCAVRGGRSRAAPLVFFSRCRLRFQRAPRFRSRLSDNPLFGPKAFRAQARTHACALNIHRPAALATAHLHLQ